VGVFVDWAVRQFRQPMIDRRPSPLSDLYARRVQHRARIGVSSCPRGRWAPRLLLGWFETSR
jgi:hypothetical protein